MSFKMQVGIRYRELPRLSFAGMGDAVNRKCLPFPYLILS